MMMMMIVALVLLPLLLKVSSQSIKHKYDHDDGHADEDHEMFVRTYSSLFNSDTSKRYSSSNDIVNEHNRILDSFSSNRTSSSSSSSSQSSFVLNLQENCGSICHHKVSVYLNSLSPSSSSVFRPLSSSSSSSSSLHDDRYSIINVDKALVLASLDNIERLTSRYNYYHYHYYHYYHYHYYHYYH